MLFEAHQMMLEDLDYVESIQGMIEGGLNAEAAVSDTAAMFADMFIQLRHNTVSECTVSDCLADQLHETHLLQRICAMLLIR